jgi:hypothetical protein
LKGKAERTARTEDTGLEAPEEKEAAADSLLTGLPPKEAAEGVAAGAEEGVGVVEAEEVVAAEPAARFVMYVQESVLITGIIVSMIGQ